MGTVSCIRRSIFLDFGESDALFPMHCEPPPLTFIPCEEHFRPVLPTIEGNVDYLALRGQLTTMDELLRTSGVENEFVMRSLEHWIRTLSESEVEQIELSGDKAFDTVLRHRVALKVIDARIAATLKRGNVSCAKPAPPHGFGNKTSPRSSTSQHPRRSRRLSEDTSLCAGPRK